MEKQIILNHNDFIGTFNPRQRELMRDYFKFKEMESQGLGHAEICRKTGISQHRVSNWVKKVKVIPFSARCLLKAEKRGYFSIENNSDTAEKVAYLVGYNLGDGNIHRSLCHTWFYGVSDDLPVFNDLLKPFFVKGKIYVYKINNGKLSINDNAFTRFMTALGCRVGDKTKSRFGVPTWILQTEKRSMIKKKFLQGLCDSELSHLKLIWEQRFAFQSLKFYSIKIKELVDNGKIYLNQLKKLFSEFGITSTEVKIDRTYVRSKDRGQMHQLYFTLQGNYINLNQFICNVGFLHNKKRRQEMLIYANKIEMLAKKELENVRKYDKAMKLRRKGFSAYKIATKIDTPTHYVKSWLYGGHKPMMYNYVKKISNS